MIGEPIRDYDFDEALSVYLGGPRDSTAIQIGEGDERLVQRYGSGATKIKDQLDALLSAVLSAHPGGFNERQEPVERWLLRELPGLSETCRRKVAAYAWLQFT